MDRVIEVAVLVVFLRGAYRSGLQTGSRMRIELEITDFRAGNCSCVP